MMTSIYFTTCPLRTRCVVRGGHAHVHAICESDEFLYYGSIDSFIDTSQTLRRGVGQKDKHAASFAREMP